MDDPLIWVRAIHLAAAEAPVLRGVRAGMLPETCLQGLAESAQGAPLEQMQVAFLAVVTHLIGLLALFKGDPMTVRLVQDVWPEASFEGMSGKEGKA